MPARRGPPTHRTLTITIDGIPTDVDINCDQQTAVITVDRVHHWRFQVQRQTTILVETDAGELCPDWLEELLFGLGIQEVVAE